MLLLTKQNRDQEKNQSQKESQEQSLTKAAFSFGSRRKKEEKPSLSDALLEVIASTPGYEDLPPEELEEVKEGLLEFARISYSIFQKEYLPEADELPHEDSEGIDISIIHSKDRVNNTKTAKAVKPKKQSINQKVVVS
ncbi:hypothetical protein [Adhaeribacter soli]|uniref:Uncharacterized protein n=1 Tax=Adhaeribacter soli TaxID=2607655 RepID=A0A5N1IWU9_9BACT|nr:hypothetical protein [Adhaeribacter soli]KAA9338800.1 hypothetical protein F0P94_08365 [Adhaeribacter soli]